METLTKSTAYAARSTAKAVVDHLPRRDIITLESSHIIQDTLGLHIIALLSLLWLSAQLQRYIARDLNAGCWYGWDALALAAVALLSQQRQYAIACVLTPAYFVWTRIPGSPFSDLHLPSFHTFLETTSKQGQDGSAAQGAADAANIPEDAPSCLVCWSSEQTPMVLACKHFMCRECLSTMKDRRQTSCPFCQRPLFSDNDGLQCAVHKAVVAALAARLATNGICYLLQLWHGQYWEVAQSAITYLPQFYCFRTLHFVILTQGDKWWQFGMFDYLMPLPVPDGRFWQSVWPPMVLTMLLCMGVYGGLHKIEKLDLIVERVIHHAPFNQLYAP